MRSARAKHDATCKLISPAGFTAKPPAFKDKSRNGSADSPRMRYLPATAGVWTCLPRSGLRRRCWGLFARSAQRAVNHHPKLVLGHRAAVDPLTVHEQPPAFHRFPDLRPLGRGANSGSRPVWPCRRPAWSRRACPAWPSWRAMRSSAAKLFVRSRSCARDLLCRGRADNPRRSSRLRRSARPGSWHPRPRASPRGASRSADRPCR